MAGGSLKSIIGSIRRKPSSAPDRRTDSEASAKVEKTGVMHDILTGGFKNAKFLAEALPALASGAPLDDKELLLENGVAMLQKLPPNSGLSSMVSDGFIKMLYGDLPHPSTTIAGPTAVYRRHDGGGNNPWLPEMGKAGTPYSRNVPPMKAKGPNLPDPELVYEQLLRRPDEVFRKHPSGLNRLFFSFATIVIHECFQTNRKNQWINETSHYVDLSTLYGNTEKEQVRVRTYNNGTIYNDSIASERILLMPPGVVALAVLFSRNHNTIVSNLLSVNEKGKYKDWDSLDEEGKKWQDNDLFQLARNINVGFFATVVLKDYVAAILNTPRADSDWSLDLGKEIKSGGTRVERGTGNVVSVEFAVLYHWHASLSHADAEWMEELLRENLPELGSIHDMTPDLFKKVLMQEGHKLMATQPKDWTFGGLKRDENGRFNDVQLADLIKDCIEEPAHAFGAHGTPASLKVVDIMGQLQAREIFNVCTLNEFRSYLNLKPYESFEDWCEDKDTARAAELLYSHIDNLELYPGLMAECTKPPVAGSGVCPGQTTGRGILDDAVALVRGDRFLSYDFNSNTLTNWGASKLTDIPGGAYGGMLPKLIFNGLPTNFTGTSAYALLPFYTPEAVSEILKGNKVVNKYDLRRPAQENNPAIVYTFDACKKILFDRDNFRTLTNEPRTVAPLFFDEGFENSVRSFIAAETAQSIRDCSLKYGGTRRSIDVVRDITNIVPITWLARRLAIPLKTVKSPRGLLTQPELFEAYTAIFEYQSFNILPVNEWGLREGYEKSAPILKQIIEAHLSTQQGVKEKFVDWMEKGTAFELSPEADKLYHALNATKRQPNELSDDIIRLTAPMAGVLTQQTSLLVDLFLSEGYEEYKMRLVALAQRPETDTAATAELETFVYEGMRHAGVVPALPRVASQDCIIPDGARGDIPIKANQTVLVATAVAAMDATAFPDPEKLTVGSGPTLTAAATTANYDLIVGGNLTPVLAPAIAAMLREIFKLPNIRRAAGRRGQFTTVTTEVAGLKTRKYLDANARESIFPTSLVLEYDDGAAAAVTNGTAATNGHTNGHAATNGAGRYGAPAGTGSVEASVTNGTH